MSDAPIPGIVRLHMGVVATRAIRPVLISDTITVFLNNVLVSFKSDGGRVAGSTLQLTDAMVGDYRVLKVINVSETVDPNPVMSGVTDTLVADRRAQLQMPLTEAVDPNPVPPTITDAAVFDVHPIAFDVPPETVDWTVPAVGMTDGVTMVGQNLYQIIITETIASNRFGPTITEVVNTILI